MDKENYITANIESWNEAADIHQKINSGLHAKVNDPLFNNLSDSVVQRLNALGIKGKSCVQICCNNGIDIISVKKLGAGYCLGIDGAEKFVDQARQLGKSANVTDLEFVTSKIDEISSKYNQQFDIALVTVGVLNWMPDLSEFFNRASLLIKANGHLVIEDMHPVLGMYEEGNPSYIEYSYFNKTAIPDEQGLDYFTGKKYKAKPNYWFQHTLSDIFTAAIDADLVLQKFEETPEDISLFCSDLEEAACNPPLGFMAQWQKSKQ
jgi:ubiquinone/menaquinone biosynthesis C-methylase UbiE